MSFHQPSVWFLLAFAVLPVAWWRWRRARPQRAIAFSAVGPIAGLRPSWAARLAWTVPALRSLAIAVLVLAIARPQAADQRTRVETEGIAIQLVVDRSGSMEATDYTLDGRPASRLEAVKRVVAEFVGGGEGLKGRPDDLVGLIAFGTFADSICPLTLDHDHVLTAVRGLSIPGINSERGTSIGDAIALGVERIHRLDEETHAEYARRIKGKVMILLTDGRNETGDIDPLVAAEMAAAYGIHVYAIGAGSDAGTVPGGRDIFGRPVGQRVGFDEETLREIARITEGEYFHATDADSLRAIYARIDELERTEIRARRYTDYQELALRATAVGPVIVPGLLSIVFALLILEIVLSSTRLRRIT